MLSKSPRIVTDYLSELKIRCDYFSRGCRDFVQLGDLDRHVKDCGFTPVLCSNEGCVVEMNKRDRSRHETEVCEFRKVKCRDCSELRQEVDEVKVNLNEMKVNLKKANEKLDEMNINFKTASEKMNKMEENQRKFEQVATDIQKMKEQMTKEVRGSYNDINNIKQSVVVAGGWGDHSNRLRSVEMFDWSTRMWSPLQRMKECRSGASSFIYKDQLTVAGGFTDDSLTDTMTSLNIRPIMDSTPWFDFPAKLPNKLSGNSNVLYDERLVTTGGFRNDTYSDCIHEILLVQPYTRNLLSRMPHQVCFHGAQLFDDKIFIVGGMKTSMLKDTTSNVLMYDINKKECKQMAPLPFAVCTMATVRWGDNVIVIGGIDKDGKVLNTVVIYNVQTGKSHVLPEMKYKRQKCTAVVSQCAIVVMGGSDERNRSLNSVECFTFDRYYWEDLPQMNEARQWATAVGW